MSLTHDELPEYGVKGAIHGGLKISLLCGKIATAATFDASRHILSLALQL
jgi:hypothetical protein